MPHFSPCNKSRTATDLESQMCDSAGPLGLFNKRATLTWKYLLNDLFYDFLPLFSPTTLGATPLLETSYSSVISLLLIETCIIYSMTAYKRL